MKKIAVCYKWVLSDADIRIQPGTRKLDLEKCKAQINDYDRMGMEIGVRLKEAAKCELVGVTCGPAALASARDALSRGLDAVYALEDPALAKADSTVTAKVLAAMIRSLGDVDVVICSEGSSDNYAQQVGPRLAALLGFASVSYVSAAEFNGTDLTLERKLEDCVECVRVTGPVVISVVPDICEAPIPSVKQILAAKKKPVTSLSLADAGLAPEALEPQLSVLSVTAPLSERKQLRLNPEGVALDAAAAELVKRLAADGVL